MNFLTTCLREVWNFFAEILFGCSHTKLTRPFTLGDQTYEVCLDCGKQIYYSAKEMRPLTAWEVRRMKATHAGEVKVVPIPAGVSQLLPTPGGKSNLAA